MDVQEYRFYQQTDVDRDIICDVLDKWCVPYKVVRRRLDNFPFPPQEEFDIVVHLTDEKWVWIRQKVWDRIEQMNQLEEFYDLEPVEHPEKDQDALPSKGKIGLKNLFKGESTQIFDTKDRGGVGTIELGMIPKDPEFMDFAENIMKKIKERIDNRHKGKLVNYTELPKDVRKELLANIPMTDIIEGKCKIYQTEHGYIVEMN